MIKSSWGSYSPKMNQYVMDQLKEAIMPLRFKVSFRPIKGEYCDIVLQSETIGSSKSYCSANASYFVDHLEENIIGHLNVIMASRLIAKRINT